MTNEKKETKTKKKWIRKTLKWLISGIIGLIILIAGGIYYAYNYYDWQSIVRNIVHQQGSAVVGTDVNIGTIKLSLKDGNGSVSNITVANPKGYSQDYIIKLGDVAVSVDKESVIKLAKETAQKTGSKIKTVVINEIRVSKPEVTYELMNLNKSNSDDIMANIKKNTASSSKQPEKKKAESDVEYKVAIKKVTVANGKATVAANLLGASQSLSLDLPTITISNLGTEKQGITIEDGLARIFQEILKTTTSVVSKADLSGILGGVGDLAGAAVDTAGKAAGAAVDTAGKAAGAATEGVSKGVKGLTDSVGSLF
ncbi:MAG: hypothetical protein IJ532_07375 [Alphaproteobacteria bacterium]|nr:hypothetical protein [Alphaproteobacteria bacterium]